MSLVAPLQTQAAKPQPRGGSSHAGLLLQRKCACGSPISPLTGECARCKSKERLQTKLNMGASNDPLEQKADRVAAQVLTTPSHSAVRGAPMRIRRFNGHATEQADTAPASVDRVHASTGRALSPALQPGMEQRFGHDFSRVRVHSGWEAEQSAQEVNANAYTEWRNVVFAEDPYSFGTHEGRRLIAHELVHVEKHSGADAVRVGQSDNEGLSPNPHAGARIPWSWTGAGVGALGGAVGGAIIGGLVGGLPGALIGAGIGAVVGGVAGGLIGGAAASVVPTAISRTQVAGDTPGLGPTYYGSVFQHTLSTTGGTITPDVTIAERVSVTRDDFATGFTGVPLGTLTWGPGGTAPLSGNDMYDNIGTSNINVTNFLPSPPKPGLPAIMETPQELHYRIGTGSWTKFADVPMVVTLRAKVGGGYEVETRNNSVPSVQNYTGPS